MFGYVTADTRRLSKKSRAEYRKVYCGLCTALGKNYGVLSRLMLSYDTAFLLTLLSEDGCECTARCPYFPTRKCRCISGECADYCADVTVLLACLKYDDDIADDNSIKAKLLRRLFKKQYKKAYARQGALADKIIHGLKELARAEGENETNPDIPANIFGNILGDIFARDESLREFGFYLGKFIYLADAACDFKSDIKKGRYNPLIKYRKSDFYPMLAHCMGKCTECFDKLEIKKHRDIIENVLYHGVWLKPTLKGINDDRSV